MNIKNIHERKIKASARTVGELLDSVSSSEDKIWPVENWSKIKFDRPLEVGAIGGHGAIKYKVIEYNPSSSIKFKFTKDLEGYHEMVITEINRNECLLRHSIYAKVTGFMIFLWPIMIRPLHNALIEDLLDKVEIQLSSVKSPKLWNSWVKLLRRLIGMHSSKKSFDINIKE